MVFFPLVLIYLSGPLGLFLYWLEKYNNLAREALSSGDKILSENYLQHADHFARILSLQEVSKSSEEKNEFIKNFALINPVISFQNQINAFTGTDYYSYLRYRKYIQTIIDKKIGLILEDTWNKVTVNKKRYIEYIEKFKL